MGVGVLLGTEVAGEGVSCCRVWKVLQGFDEGFRVFSSAVGVELMGFSFELSVQNLRLLDFSASEGS